MHAQQRHRQAALHRGPRRWIYSKSAPPARRHAVLHPAAAGLAGRRRRDGAGGGLGARRGGEETADAAVIYRVVLERTPAGGASACTPCPPGTYSAGPTAECAACPPGYTSAPPATPPSGATACAACPPGTFAPVAGSPACRFAAVTRRPRGRRPHLRSRPATLPARRTRAAAAKGAPRRAAETRLRRAPAAPSRGPVRSGNPYRQWPPGRPAYAGVIRVMTGLSESWRAI